MLVLSRKVGERILLGDDVTITIVRLTNGVVRIGIDAPHDMRVVREEISGQEESRSDQKQFARTQPK